MKPVTILAWVVRVLCVTLTVAVIFAALFMLVAVSIVAVEAHGPRGLVLGTLKILGATILSFSTILLVVSVWDWAARKTRRK